MKTSNNVIVIVQAIESSVEKATRLLGVKIHARAAGGQGGSGTAVLKCYCSQYTGHQRSDCKEPEKDLN